MFTPIELLMDGGGFGLVLFLFGIGGSLSSFVFIFMSAKSSRQLAFLFSTLCVTITLVILGLGFGGAAYNESLLAEILVDLPPDLVPSLQKHGRRGTEVLKQYQLLFCIVPVVASVLCAILALKKPKIDVVTTSTS